MRPAPWCCSKPRSPACPRSEPRWGTWSNGRRRPLSPSPVGDAIALAAAIISLLNDDERRLRIARAAQTRAIAEDADYTARRFTALYEQVA